MADTVRVTKLGRGRRGGRRGRNTLRNIGASDVDKERTARIAAKKAEKARAKNDPNKKPRKTPAQRRRAAMDEKGRQIKRTTTTTPRLQQTLAGAGAAAGMLGGPLAKVVGAGGRVLGKAIAGKVGSAGAKKGIEAVVKKAPVKKKVVKKAPVKKTKTEKKPVEMSAAARKKAENFQKGYKERKPKNRFSSPANAKIAKNATKAKPPKAGKGKSKGKGKDNKSAVTAAASKSKNIGRKIGTGLGLATVLGTGAYMGGRKPSGATPRPPKPDNKIDFSVDDEDRIVEQGRTITSNPKGDGSRTGLDLETLLSRIEDRKDMQDPEDVQHDLADLKADLKELRGYRHGGPVRRSRTTNQFRGWGKARKPKHKMR
jgi:hypothetical protein